MVNKETAPGRVPREIVDEMMGIKRKQVRLQRGVTAATAAAVAGAAALGYGAYKLHQSTKPETWEAKNPAMVQAVRAGDFHGYDRAAIQTYPGLKKSSPVILKHWDAITNIAGNTYNTLAVLDTLSRVPGSSEEAGTSIKINQWAGTDRTGRRADIIGKASALPNSDELFRDLYKLPSSKIEDAREVFYGKKNGERVWEYGKLRSSSGTNAPAFRPAKRGQVYKQRYQGMRAKSLHAKLRQHQQHRRV